MSDTTTTQAKELLFGPEGSAHKGAHCQVCGRFVKIYRRSLACGMARSLIALYRHSLINDDWIDITKYLMKVKLSAANTNAALLRHWGLLEKKDGERDDGSKRLGFYRVPASAHSFIKGTTTVPKYIYTYNDDLLGLSDGNYGPDVKTTIHDALKKKFSYRELMDG